MLYMIWIFIIVRKTGDVEGGGGVYKAHFDIHVTLGTSRRTLMIKVLCHLKMLFIG